MIEEGIFLASVAWFSWKGFRSGVPRMLLGFGVLLTSYLATWLFSQDLSKVLVDDYGLSFIQAYIAGALAVFFGCYFFLSILITVIGKLSGRVHYIDASVRGAILGSVFGAVIGLFLAWAGGVMVSSIAEKKNIPALSKKEPAKQGPIEKISGDVVNKAVETAIKAATPEADETVVEVSAALISNPVKVTNQINELVANRDFNEMMKNPAILSAMNRGDADALANHPDFKNLVSTKEVKELSSTLKLKDDELGNEKFAESMITAWQRVEQVKNTPRFQALIRDPEVQKTLQSQNPMDILSNPKANELLKVILNPDGSANPRLQNEIENTMEEIQSGQSQTGPATPQEDQALPEEPVSDLPVNQEFWKWTDEKGRTHFTSHKPEGVEAELITY